MEKCASCSKTNRWLAQTNRRIENINACTAQFVQTIQKLLQELNERDAQCSESNMTGDEGNGGHEPDDSDSDSIDTDDGSEQKNAYFCPEVECRQRKADATFKKYSRHYQTHVACAVPCAGCRTTLTRVSTLRRHFTDCVELKQKRAMTENSEIIEQMKRQKDIESKRASYAAQAALRGHKRRHPTQSTISRSRKKSKSERHPSNSLSADRIHVPKQKQNSEQQPRRSITDNDEQQSHIPKNIVKAVRPTYFEEPQGGAQKNVTTGTGGAEATSEKIDEVLVFLENDQQSTAPDTQAASIPPNGLSEMTHALPTYSSNQYSPIPNPASATNALGSYFANDQHSTRRCTSPALRGSSFLSYTMDGSFMYSDSHLPILQDTAKAKRGSSFMRNTMDGSFMYADDMHASGQNMETGSFNTWNLT